MGIRMVDEGAEARIYRGRVLGFDAAIKERISKSYRIRQIDESLRSSRTRSEARILAALAGRGVRVPALLMVDRNTIYMEWVGGRRLSTLSPGRRKMTHYMQEAGRQLGMLHNEGVAHGDYTPANLVADKGAIYVIDFGLSSVTNSAEGKALDLLLMKRSVDASLYKSFVAAYGKSCIDHLPILRKLAEIETRGRYQTRTLTHV